MNQQGNSLEKNIATYIRSKGLNLSVMARETGIPYMFLYDSFFNTNRSRSIKGRELISVCAFLDVNPMNFMNKQGGRERVSITLPSSINILGMTYQVKEVEVVNKETFLFGEINFITQVIKIDSSLTQERKNQVLMHEIFHGVLEALGLDELNEDEKVVQSISATLYHLFSSQVIFSF